MWGRGENSMCSKATKGAAEKEASVLPMKKGTGAQRHAGYVPKRCSIGGKRIENQR